MTNSPFLNIPFLSDEGTSVVQPLNFWVEVLDRMARGIVAATQNDPPGGGPDGNIYLVDTVPTGAWVGHAGDLAVGVGTNFWHFVPQLEGQGPMFFNATSTYVGRGPSAWDKTFTVT